MSSDIMHDFVEKEIKAVFSSYDGWNMTRHNLGGGYDTLATLERQNGGHRECVRILVTFAKDVSPDLLGEVKKPVRTSDGTITRNAYAIMVPANADTSAVPGEFKVYTMKSFAFDGKALTWVKKPVQKTEPPKSVS